MDKSIRCVVLTAMNIEMVFCNVATCSLVDRCQRLGETCCLQLQVRHRRRRLYVLQVRWCVFSKTIRHYIWEVHNLKQRHVYYVRLFWKHAFRSGRLPATAVLFDSMNLLEIVTSIPQITNNECYDI
jgi:hypothetical protein